MLEYAVVAARSGAPLTLPEELLLLRAKGLSRPRHALSATVDRPLAAARLVELLLGGRIRVDIRRRGPVLTDAVHVIDPSPTGDPLLDDVVHRMASEGTRSCSYWLRQASKGAEMAYWDRLVSRSLLRPAGLDAEPLVPDTAAVAATTARIRSVLADSVGADLRSLALVSLLVHTGSLFGVLHDLDPSPAGLVRGYRDQRRTERAIDAYRRAAGTARDTPDAIERLAALAAT